MEFLFFAVAVVFALIFMHFQHQGRKQAWTAAAAQLDAVVQVDSMWSHPVLGGEIDGMAFQVRGETRGSGKSRRTVTVLETQDMRTVVLNASRESVLSHLRDAFVGEDLQIGSPMHDDALKLGGDDMQILATLTPAVRDALVSWVNMGGRVRGGDIYKEQRGMITSASELVGLVNDAANLNELLRRPADVPKALAGRVLDTRETVGVRVRALEVLCANSDGTEAIVALGEQENLPPELLFAALRRGPVRGLRALESRLPELYADTAYASAAVRAATRLHAEVPLHTLQWMLAAGPEEVMAAAEHIEQRRMSEALGTLMDVIEVDDAEAQVAVISAIGAVGTVLNVEGLMPYTKGMLRSAAVKAAATRAIATLQSGVGAGARGGISMAAAPEGGALSEASAIRGALTPKQRT